MCSDTEKKTGRPPKKEIRELVKTHWKEFYDKHYKPLCVPDESIHYKPLCVPDESIDYDHMNTILDYLTIYILTMYENVVWQKKMMAKLIRQIKKTKKEREQAVRNLTTQLRKIKLDLLNVDSVTLKSHTRYHHWIEEERLLLIPQKEEFKKKQNCITTYNVIHKIILFQCSNDSYDENGRKL